MPQPLAHLSSRKIRQQREKEGERGQGGRGAFKQPYKQEKKKGIRLEKMITCVTISLVLLHN